MAIGLRPLASPPGAGQLGEGAKGKSPYPLPQTPTPNPLSEKKWHRGPAGAKTFTSPLLATKRYL